MDRPQPIYTGENCTFSCPLQWGVSAFWRETAAAADWLPELVAALERDGIRILSHKFSQPTTSQFLVSTKPDVAPVAVVQRLKGRLQYLLRSSRPRIWKGNYAVRSIGNISRETIEGYIAGQIDHHLYADPRAQERLQRYQIVNEEVDLSLPRSTSHGRYWYNLHLVLVRRNRERDWTDAVLESTRRIIVAAARAKGHLLSRGGILPDHVHLLIGCQIDEAPLEVALGYLNNLAFVQAMRPVFQFGAFVGTVGEYTNRAIGRND